MVSGHLQIKKGHYYVVLSYLDSEGQRHRKWVATGLPEKGKKRRAEEKLAELRTGFVIPKEGAMLEKDMLFSDYLLSWVEIAKLRIKITTYASYISMIKNPIAPYFKKKGFTLQGLEARHIQSFYSERVKQVSGNTVIHYHAIIHSALKYAVKIDMIPSNPADKIDRPRKDAFVPDYYTMEEMTRLFEVLKGHQLELPCLVAAFYGLRRSEVIGLKWDAINFEKNTITIKHTVAEINIDGKQRFIEQNTAKTKSSLRTLPLIGQFKEYFQKVRQSQEANRKICGNAYSKKYDGYVFVDELGERMKPSYLTGAFPEFAEKHGLRRIRFHDLRHSCASLLIANGVPIKQIQEWMGHSDFSTTANIYAHLDFSAKLSSAQALEQAMRLPDSSGLGSKWA